ncbi:MAG: nicotinamide riboside transporter PnuC [Bacteroidales bacterium]|jgi:nicotinamide mononucleotide transporter
MGLFLELFGAASGLLYVWLEIKHKRAMWAVGFVMSVSYVVVFGIKGLYASMGLYVYFLIMSIYGWYKWSTPLKQPADVSPTEEETHQPDHSTTQLRPVHVNARQAAIAGALLLSSFALMWYVLRRFTDHPAPALDAAVTALNIAATWLLAHSVLQQWILLIAANALAIGLYTRSGLWFTTVLYAVLLASSFIGYSTWRRKIH